VEGQQVHFKNHVLHFKRKVRCGKGTWDVLQEKVIHLATKKGKHNRLLKDK
jgi:hypothetical protein